MKTHINQLGLKGFKSFNRKIDLLFGPGVNCIIGPNGSGKSNVGDAICFLLGRLSSKDLRADNYSDLVFKKKGGKSAIESEVHFQLDNKAGAFNLDSKIIEIKRRIKKSGQTQYKLNGKNATRQQVLELLAPHRIHPDGHNIILQGDISRFVHMRPVEKRQVIEEVAGIGVYEERKQRTLKELEKVGGKVKEAQIIVTEKETFLKNLEKEKAEAEKFRSAKDLLEAAKASEIKLRINHVEKRRASNETNFEKASKNIEKSNIQIEKINSKLGGFKKESDDIETTIRKKGGEEDIALRKSVEDLRVNVEKSKALIDTSQNELTRFENRKSDLKNSLNELEEKILDKKEEKIHLEKELSVLEKKGKSKQDTGFQVAEQKLEKIEKQVEELQNKHSELNNELQKTQSELKLVESQLNNSNERLNDIAGGVEIDLPASKSRYKNIISEINKIASEDSRLALKLGDLRKNIIKKEEELAKARVHAGSAQELLMRDTAIKTILSKKISGVHGTVSDLGKVDSKFSTALKVAAGGRMRNIVVEKPDVAIRCLGILKQSRAGIATFLPLSKLRKPIAIKVPSKKGVYGFACDLISSDKKFSPLFKYVFGNTLVVEDVAIAKAIGIGKYRIVTLDGDLFELSGAITGGFRRKNIGIVFEDKTSVNKIGEFETAIAVFRKQTRQLEEQRCQIDIKLIKLRKEKVELESKIELSQNVGGKEKKKELESKIKGLLAQKKKLKLNHTSIEKEINKLENKLSGQVSQRDDLRVKVKEAMTRLQSKDDDAETQTRRKLVVLKAELENALLPEKENISNVLRSLEKDAVQFKKQMSDEQSKLKKLEKELKEKAKEEEKSHSKLRDLYAKKGKLNESIRDEEDKLLAAREQLNKAMQEKNSLSVLNAELEGELAGLKEEFQPHEKTELLESLKTIEEAKKKIRYLEHRLAEMGNVNLKALEAYEIVKKEYENLAWKLSKLNTEKEDVLEVIAEIDKKKKDTFMKTFNEIANNFEAIFTKIADKHVAKLTLENEETPFEGGITVSVTDAKGKHISLASLSGGEKVLVALALIFSVQEHEPAPFYLFDEIDAALDKVNSEKVAKLLKDYGKKAQIIIISHNDAVISEADALYGVSMNKDTGESNIVSLKI